MQFLTQDNRLDLSMLPTPAAADPTPPPAPTPRRLPQAAAATFTAEITTLLTDVLAPSKGRPVSKSDDPAAVRRRVTRPGGYATKTALLFSKILDAVNTTHDLGAAPLELRDVMSHMPAGRTILDEVAISREQRTLAEAACNLGTQAGRACKAGVLGVLASVNDAGQVSTARVADLTGVSTRTVRRAREATDAGRPNTFTTQSKAQGGKRCGVGDVERQATIAWMRRACPARSGDQFATLWMTKSKEDFYFEDYRSVSAQATIYEHALAASEELRSHIASGSLTSQWERNVAMYVGRLPVTDSLLTINFTDSLTLTDAKNAGQTDSLSVKVLWEERPKLDDGSVAALVRLVPDNAPPEIVQEEVNVPPPDVEADDNAPDSQQQQRVVLMPRTYRTFYGSILRKERVWQRPPDDHCSRCSDFTTKTARHLELTRAVSVIEDDPNWDWANAIVSATGGPRAAHEEARQLALQLPDLKKHVTWRARQRAYLKRREQDLPPSHQLWQLDYGGLTDSCGRKVSVWSATVIRPGGNQQESIDFFFDAANQGGAREGAAKKDGQTGIFFLHELFDPARNAPRPDGTRVSMVHQMFPEVKHVILSGDTGNGYRAYAMLDALGRMKEQSAGISFELIPLAPGHAFNRTDARIAHLNTFLRGLKRRSRVFGAKAVASAFHAASNPATANRRKHLRRSQCFFRRVVVDRAAANNAKKQFGAPLVRANLDKGHMGVRGFLFFDFRHGDGYATVREHGDPTMLNNPSMLYTWRKDLSKKMCQRCSDRLGHPTLLARSGCSKQRCAFRENPPVVPQQLPMMPQHHEVALAVAPAAAAPVPAPADAPAEAPNELSVDSDGEGDWLVEDGSSDAGDDLAERVLPSKDAIESKSGGDPSQSDADGGEVEEKRAPPDRELEANSPPSSSEGDAEDPAHPADDERDDDTPPPLTDRADWISWRVLRPFTGAAGSRDTPHERATREYDAAVIAASGSGGRRRRRMPDAVMTSCQGSRQDLKRILQESAASAKGNKRKRTKQ
jgi:hypothetical protein